MTTLTIIGKDGNVLEIIRTKNELIVAGVQLHPNDCFQLASFLMAQLGEKEYEYES